MTQVSFESAYTFGEMVEANFGAWHVDIDGARECLRYWTRERADAAADHYRSRGRDASVVFRGEAGGRQDRGKE